MPVAIFTMMAFAVAIVAATVFVAMLCGVVVAVMMAAFVVVSQLKINVTNAYAGSIAAPLDESVCAEPSTNVPNAVAHPSPALIADAFDTGSDAAKKPA